MSQNLQNIAKIQKFQLENLVDFEKFLKIQQFSFRNLRTIEKLGYYDLFRKICCNSGNFVIGEFWRAIMKRLQKKNRILKITLKQ